MIPLRSDLCITEKFTVQCDISRLYIQVKHEPENMNMYPNSNNSRVLTFRQGMDAQPDRRKVALTDLSAQLVEANPSTKYQVIDDLLVVGHVIDNPLKRCLPHSLCFRNLW